MKKVVPKLRQEVKVKFDIVTSGNIKIYYTGKFQDFTARYVINTYANLIFMQTESIHSGLPAQSALTDLILFLSIDCMSKDHSTSPFSLLFNSIPNGKF